MKTEQAFKQHFEKSDKIMLMVNYGLVAYALALANWYNTWTEALIISGTTVVALTAIFLLAKATVLSRIAMSLGFMVMTALHIHQAHGMIEFHFGVFVLLAILLYYRDWLPIVIAAGAIAAHHLTFYYMQTKGADVYLFQNTDSGWWVVFLHAAYVVVETALLLWLANNLRKEHLQSLEIIHLTAQMTSEQNIDLTLRSSGSTVLLNQFDEFTSYVEQLAKQVRHVASKLSGNGQSLAKITDEMDKHLQVQQRETNAISVSINAISGTVEEVSEHSSIASNSADKVSTNANDATKVSDDAQKSIKKLADQVHAAANNIRSLNEHSKSIGSVLDVIRSVSDQTNLLALNAAIEAARAGEQGRGFAVVADEVRTLAQRAHESTEEIDRLIETLQAGSESAVSAVEASRDMAEQCVKDTENSQNIMEQARSSIREINSMNAKIDSAAKQQSQAITEISHNLSNILEASNKTAKDSSQAAEASALLLELSESLDTLTKRFKVS